MALQKTSKKNALAHMSSEERAAWECSLCGECKHFNGFLIEDQYDIKITYFNCKARNTTGADFVRDMCRCYCSFYKSINSKGR